MQDERFEDRSIIYDQVPQRLPRFDRASLPARFSSFVVHRASFCFTAERPNERTNERTSYLTVVKIDATVTAVDDQLAGVV